MIIQIEPWIDAEELQMLTKVVESTYVTEHNLTKEFEARCCALTGAKYAVSMTNGTLALFAAIKSLGIGSGDEVIVPNLTFIATANAVILAGGTPVFCDVESSYFGLDPSIIAQKITSKTKAIMPVHLYGQSADMQAILQIAKDNNLYVIEDAAQGVGVKRNGKHVGTYGDLGVLSFYGNKTITCGEGGVILTDNEVLAEKCYQLKNHGRSQKGIFIHEEIGFNFAFTEMQAAIGLAQLNKLDRIIARKKEIHDKYIRDLSGIEEFVVCKDDPNTTTPVYWFTSFKADKAIELATYLRTLDIQTRRFFYPLDQQPCYLKNKEIHKRNNDQYPISHHAYEVGISLPSSYGLSSKDQDVVINAIRGFYGNGG